MLEYKYKYIYIFPPPTPTPTPTFPIIVMNMVDDWIRLYGL